MEALVAATLGLPGSLTLTVGTTDIPGPSRMLDLVEIVEYNLHGNTLHDLHVIARGVFRRQEAESGAAATLDAIDMGR